MWLATRCSIIIIIMAHEFVAGDEVLSARLEQSHCAVRQHRHLQMPSSVVRLGVCNMTAQGATARNVAFCFQHQPQPGFHGCIRWLPRLHWCGCLTALVCAVPVRMCRPTTKSASSIRSCQCPDITVESVPAPALLNA